MENKKRQRAQDILKGEEPIALPVTQALHKHFSYFLYTVFASVLYKVYKR